jgi:hypothetical protein
MAVMNLETLVLGGVSVACDVVTALKGIGSKPVNCQTPALDLSHARHPSQRDQADQAMRPWYPPANPNGMGNPTVRAGRSASRLGVRASRSHAIAAWRTVLSGWSLATGGACPTAAVGTGRLRPGIAVSVGEELLECSRFHPTGRLQAGGQRDLPRLARGLKRRMGDTTWFRSFTGTPSASTREK